MELPFEVGAYNQVVSSWPQHGKFILATFDSDIIIVYQAYNPTIAKWAVEHKTFVGCPQYNVERMTWIKTNFLWMMFRSGWASKENQERILAISVSRNGFEEILRNASVGGQIIPEVRLQWDPDHDYKGDKVERRAIQLGLRGQILKTFLKEWITDIEDITDFVTTQRAFVQERNVELLKVPFEKVYPIQDPTLRTLISSDF